MCLFILHASDVERNDGQTRQSSVSHNESRLRIFQTFIGS
jgi:hypothetical protein